MMEITEPESKDRVADWVELYLLFEDNTLSRKTLETLLERSLGVEPSEAFMSDVWKELSARAVLYSKTPYKISDTQISQFASPLCSPEYAACLILSLYGVDERDREIASIFEELSKVAVNAYLKGKAFVMGWNTQPGGTAKIADKVKNVALKTGERFSAGPPSRYKDRGVDVVAHKGFPDSRSGQLVILVQSAAGTHWSDKKPVPLDSWKQYIHWACDPLRAFAFPQILTDPDIWHEESREKGLLFDRARLLHFLADNPIDRTFSGNIACWVTLQYQNMSAQ